MDVSTGEINRQQRVILVAEDYDYEDLTATKWLRERHGMEIRCIRATMATDTQGNEYLSCTDLSDWSLPIYRMFRFRGDEQTRAEARLGGRRIHPRSGTYQAEHLNQDFHFGPGTATVYTRSAPNSTSFHAEPCTSPLLVVARAGSTAHSR